MKYFEALKEGEQRLLSCQIEDAKTDAWLLFAYVTGISRAMYLAKMRDEMSTEHDLMYQKVLERRAQHIPLQHITGTQDFMGLTFHVNEHVLIPRQDTEVLVEQVLQQVKEGTRILDMCTGSGCIAISIACLRKGSKVTASDISEEALKVAKENAMQLGADVAFVQGNLFEAVEGEFDIIVSNPPYICSDVIQTLAPEVRIHEPMLALDGSKDGLYFYRQIIENSRAYLKKNGQIWLEIGHDQGESVPELLKKNGFAHIRVIKDLAGLDRVVNAVMIEEEKTKEITHV